MTTTLTGVFESASEAGRARSRLIDSGISASAVTLDPDGSQSTSGSSTASSSSLSSSPSSSSGTSAGGEDRRGFFAKLFGWNDDDDDQDDTARRYGMATQRGHVVVAVRLDDESKVDDTIRVLDECGAMDVDERMAGWSGSDASGMSGTSGTSGRTHSSGSTGSATDMAATGEAMSGMSGMTGASGMSETPSASGAMGIGASDLSSTSGRTAAGASGDQTLRAVAEELVVGKRTVQRGRVRIHRSVTEVPVEQQVSLQEERVRVERVPVDRIATEADLSQGFDERDITLTETAEEAVVGKVARVVEEVRVGTEARERVETVRDTVRRSEIDVENTEDVPSSMRDLSSTSDSLGSPMRGIDGGRSGDDRDGMSGMSGMGSRGAGDATGVGGMSAAGGMGGSGLSAAGSYAGPERRHAMAAPFTGDERRRNLV